MGTQTLIWALSLAAVAILLAGDSQAQRSGTAQVTAPAETADLIDRLRASGAVLIYDPQTRKIRSPSARGAAPDRSELGAGGASSA